MDTVELPPAVIDPKKDILDDSGFEVVDRWRVERCRGADGGKMEGVRK